MSTPPARRIASASDAIAEALREHLECIWRERHRRRLVALIDTAIAECEQANLDACPANEDVGPPAGLPAPEFAAELVAMLRAAAREPCCRPATNIEALDELFRLQAAYLICLYDASGEPC